MAVADTFGLIGQILDGQLRVEDAIGEGGFSIVYKGQHIGLGEPVAIKCLKLPGRLDPSVADAFSKRFRDEGRLLYRLSQGSLNIVRSITSGTTVAPTTGVLVPYTALEWLEGHSLVMEYRERALRGEMPMSVTASMTLLEPAIRALAYAHSQGVVHRDVKPGNLYFTNTREGWKLKVLDFGLAKIFNDEALGMTSRLKTTGSFFACSPSYGAPEQFDSRSGEIGPWTDVYGMALVFVEALAGRKARHADSMMEGALLARDPFKKSTPRSLGVTLSDELEDVFARALSMDISERPPSCGELLDELRHAIYGAAAGPRISSAPPVQATPVPSYDDEEPLAAPQASPRTPVIASLARESVPPTTQRIVRPIAGTPATLPPTTLRLNTNAPAFQDVGARATPPPPPAVPALGPLPIIQAFNPLAVSAPAPPPASAPRAAAPNAAALPALPVPESSGSRALWIVSVTLLILALMAAAAWGGYRITKERPPPVGGAPQLREGTCPSSRT